MADDPAAGEPGFWYPDATDGLDGVKFMLRCVTSADSQGKWVSFTAA
jgi:hypothetical protein